MGNHCILGRAEGMGGEVFTNIGSRVQLTKFFRDTSFWGFVFGSAGRPTKKYFLTATARPQIWLWQKVVRNPNYLVVFLPVPPLPNFNRKEGGSPWLTGEGSATCSACIYAEPQHKLL